MATWAQFAAAAPEMAARGAWLLGQNGGVAFLATVRKDGTPQLHPVMPQLVDGGLYVFIVEFSSKARDLANRGSYALHGIPAGPENEEFLVRGRALPIDDAGVRARAIEVCGYAKMDWETLYHFEVEHALTTTWADWGTAHPEPVFRRWRAGGPVETVGGGEATSG